MRDRPIRQWLAWSMLMFLVALLGLFGALDALLGAGSSTTGVAATVTELATTAELEARAAGRNLIVAAALLAAILLVPYRGGERWAWWVMWVLPLWALSVSVSFLFTELPPDYARPAGADSGWIWFALTAGSLLLDRRRFATDAQPQTAIAGAGAG